ncbi:MAG: SOS response-associated peptidase family protein [Pseudomonadales bacterium]|nr:SOS response-associated peptidase family protein [Pseudomonadales bacterium]MCP5215516.1 SOS response-associated peptidase family protein [Pseudomonadales bacterium]
MCTNFALIKKDGSAQLSKQLGVDETQLRYSQDIRPGSMISIVIERDGERLISDAIWWLYLQQTETGLKPHPDYFSVNTNHAKLSNKTEYRKSRCIIPATAFVESQGGKNPHLLEPANGDAIAFGGLWKEWVDKVTGQIVYSASIITLPGHPALENIHQKSTPLWLPEEMYDLWLNPNHQDIGQFAPLLSPALRTDLKATPINKATLKQPVGDSFVVNAG